MCDTPTICRKRKSFLHIGIGKGEPQKKKWIALFLSMVMILSCFSVSAVVEERYLGVMLSTNVMSLDTNLATDGESFEVIADCIANLTVKKNPDYWDADRVQLAGISYQVVGSSDNALTAFKTGSLDVVTISGNQVASAKKDGALDTYTAVPPQFAASASTGADFSADREAFAEICGYNPEKAEEYFAAAVAELGKDTFTFVMIYGNNEGDRWPRWPRPSRARWKRFSPA